MASASQFAVSRIHRNGSANFSRAMRQVVPPFLQKLYEMVDDNATDDLIRWSDTGDSFFVLDRERVAQDVLPRWFKHNNFSSFVRQLNMYGFHKIPHLQQGVLRSDSETEAWNFEHPNFHRGQPDLLCLISRKKQASERGGEEAQSENREIPNGVLPNGTSSGPLLDVNSIISGIAAIKRHQTTISADLNDLKRSNQHLWQEAMASRERHKQHQDTINRILKFLAGVFGTTAAGSKNSQSPGPHGAIPRKKQRLMIEHTQQDSSEKDSAEQSSIHDDTTYDDILHSDDPSHNSNRFTVLENSTFDSPTPTIHSPVASLDTNPYLYGQAIGQSIKSADVLSDSGIMPSLLSNTPTPSYADTTQTNRDPPRVDENSASAMNMLMSSSSQANAQDTLLQAILSSPTQLQRLMAALSTQQSLSVPQSTELTPEFSSISPSYLSAPQTAIDNITADGMPFQSPMDPFSDSQNPFLALAHSNDDFSNNWGSLLESNDQLQKSYKDAKDVSAEVDAVQASIDSFIENLGISPDVINDYHGQIGKLDADASNFGPPNENFLNEEQIKNAGSDIDLEAFLTQFDNNNVEPENLDEFTPSYNRTLQPETANTTQQGIGAFLDEVTSQSDASSPSAHRLSLDDPPPDPSVQKRGQKRKSDITELSTAADILTTRRKR